MATGRRARWASCGALAVWLLAGCAGRLAQAPQPAPAQVARAVEITDIQVGGVGEAVQITLGTTSRAAYSLVEQLSPARLVLEVVGAKHLGQDRIIPVNRGAVTLIRPFLGGVNGGVEIVLSAEAAYDVEGSGTGIVLNVSPKTPAAAPAEPPAAAAPENPTGETAAAPAEPAPAEPAPAEPAPAEPAAVEPPVPVEAAAPPPAPAVAPAVVEAPRGPRMLTAIGVDKRPDGLVVTLQGSGPLSYEYFLVEGKSLVVDIADAGNKVWPLKKKVDDAWVAQIRLGEHVQPKKTTRVVFDLKKLGEYRVDGAGDRIVVSFGAPALAAAEPSGAADATMALNTVGGVSLQTTAGGSRLEIPTSVKADFTIVDSGDAAKIIVEIANARIAESDRKTLDLKQQDRDVVRVSAFPYTRGEAQLVRVVAQLRRPVPFRAVAEDGRILVDFEQPLTVPAAAVAAAPAAPAAVAAVAAPAAPSAPAAAAAPAAMSGIPAAGPVFTGRRLSLDFKEADVNDILRLISEVSGMNFVAGSEVKGTVTIKLADVPWDQALDMILKTNQPQLAQIREADNIVRITTADKILDEEQRRRRVEEDKKKTIDAQKALEPLLTKSYAISYAEKMGELKTTLEGFKSERGRIQFDERTKTIIVQDIASNIAEIDRVLQTLDQPTPAVLVEARIVEVDSSFGQQVGVQWNAVGIRDAAHGNATDFAFPNSMRVGGTAADNNYMVNLPAASSTAGIGFSFGHIANTLSLDLRISAGEKLGKIKILSNPKVLVVQNNRAVINLGSQLPIPKTDAEGNRTVEWKDVGIKLEVLPQITNDKRVFMDIKIEKSSQGENVQTTEGSMFSIKTSRADTKVLIADGETTVIGGIFIQEDVNNTDSVPGLAKIPIFGWFFRSRDDQQRKRELMIFLTPRLVVL